MKLIFECAECRTEFTYNPRGRPAMIRPLGRFFHTPIGQHVEIYPSEVAEQLKVCPSIGCGKHQSNIGFKAIFVRKEK